MNSIFLNKSVTLSLCLHCPKHKFAYELTIFDKFFSTTTFCHFYFLRQFNKKPPTFYSRCNSLAVETF